jgi:hypothetical protein
MAKEIDEDLIEATIRRVAESKAARDVPPIEMPVAESIAPVVETPAVELAIEAAERDGSNEAADQSDDDDDIEVTPTPLHAAARGRGVSRATGSLAEQMATTPSYDEGRERPAFAARTQFARPAEPVRRAEPAAASADPAAQLEIAHHLREITHRLDTITSLVERLLNAGAPTIGPAWEQAQASSAARPPIFRDDGARPQALDVEPEIIDTRPIPKPLPPLHVEPKRGFDLLPRSYRITVEDKRRGVDLVPLHRALLGMEGVRDMSLLSYNNGVAIVALETTEELDPDMLGDAVSRAMSRDAKVEVHNEHTMVVKLADE